MINSVKTLIDKALEENQLSISKLANIINVERTWLQHALAGRRELGYENFEKIINALHLSESANTELREAFAKEYFGDTNYSIIKNTIQHLNTMYDFEKTITANTDNNTVDCANFMEQYHFNSKQQDFFNNLYKIIECELNKDTPVFYTNYSISLDCIRNLFLYILSKTQKYINYNHIIFMDKPYDEQYIIDTFLYQNEFAGYGYNTFLLNSPTPIDNNLSIFPFYVVTSDCFIIFSENLEYYIVSNNSAQMKFIQEKHNEYRLSAEPFGHFMRSTEDFSLFVSLIEQLPNDKIDFAYDLSSNLCLAGFLDKDILKDSIPDELELKDYFIYGISEFYKALDLIPTNCLFTIDSLLNFTKDDTEFTDYHNVTFDILQISPKNKLKILNKFLESSKNNIRNNYIINTKKIELPSYFHAYMYMNLILSFNFRIYDPNDCKKYIAVCCSINPVLYKHLKNITEYLIHSSNVYANSQSNAIAHINSSISYYKGKHDFE